MHFGSFTLTDTPPVYGTGCRNPQQFLREVLAEALLAEALGFNSVWVPEHHFGLFGCLSFDESRARFDEEMQLVRTAWTEAGFAFAGTFHQVREPLTVLPRPVPPHPPIYVACSRPETVVTAGALGVGSLNFTAGTDDTLADKVRSYRSAIATADVRERRLNNQFCCTPTALVLADDRTACAHGFRGSRFFAEALATYFFMPSRIVGTLDIARDNLSSGELDTAMAARNRPNAPLTAIVGDPVAARETVARFQATGVDELILVMQMGTVPQAIVLESLRTFAEQVMPHF